MDILTKFNDFLKKVEEFILSSSIILMAIILVANVVGRVFFNKSLTFAEEVSSILTVFLTFSGVSYAARVGRHINMTALFDIIPTLGKKIFLYILTVVTFIALTYLGYLSFKYVMTVFNSGRYSSALQIPLWIPYLIIPIGFFLGAFQYLMILFLNLKNKKEIYTCISPIEEAFAVEEAQLVETVKEGDK